MREPLVISPGPAAPPHGAPAIAPWVALLEPYYRRLGLRLPSTDRRAPDALPSAYRRLLAHSDDMTPTLEAFYGRPLQLKILSRDREFELYRREVVLELTGTGRPVEYGAICIHLQHLPPAARRWVLEGEQPFGRILEQEALAHLSWPQAFFSVRSDAYLERLLGARPDTLLYGRRNVIVDGRRRLLADVVEVLAPIPADVAAPEEQNPA
jgi:chorismate-pyruvate lyase